ncbi:FG-GAP-like repeat-containing protein, partial [candidate division KSB1 bacterium]|nr:FG-GAP-like repeat-containing protein [candidate division KSB1 bacterium]
RFLTNQIFLLAMFAATNFAQTYFIEHPNLPFVGAWDIDVEDINQDGALDIAACGNSNKISWWKNDDNQNFTEHIIRENFAGVRSVRADDVNGDGEIDIIAAAWIANTVTWWENDGNENFTEHTIDTSFAGAHTVAVKDVNQDGAMDILCSGFDYYGGHGEIAWWKNDGNENFAKHLVSSRFNRSPFVHSEDIDGDDDVDILACGEAKGLVLWWENDGNENFAEHTVDSNYPMAHTVFARDLDQDGDKDILGAACLSSLFTWWENDGNQNFTKHHIDNLGGALWIDAVDLDLDGDFDLIGTGTGGVFWYQNDGKQAFTRYKVAGNFGDGYCVRAPDLDQDGDFDLMAAGRSANKIVWWENEYYGFKFSADVTTGHAPLQIKFDDLSNAKQPLTAWAWDFDNDGTIDSQQRQPEWTFQNPGIYTVKLVVSNDSISQTIVKEKFIRVFDGESALLFNGDKSKVTCPASGNLNLQSNVTIEAKINPAGWGKIPNIGFGRIIDKKNVTLYLIGASPTFNDHCLALQLTHADGTVSISTSAENSISLDTWQHVAVTYNASINEVKMYINGAEQILTQTKAPSGNLADNTSSDLVIGNNAAASFGFDGVIDELRMWKTVRNKLEIQQHINQYLNGNEADLIGYWKMNEGNGELIKDFSNHQSDAAIAGANWIQGAPANLPTAIGMNLPYEKLPDSFELYSNYPNPFNSATTIQFRLPKNADISIQIFNLTGELVRTLSQGNKEAGLYSIVWDGTDNSGSRLASSVYYYKMVAGSFSEAKKLILVK